MYLGIPGMKEEGKRLLEATAPGGPAHEIVKRAVALHAFDLSSEESREALRRLEDLAACFRGDLKGFLDLLSMDRGIDHEILAGDRVSLMSLHAAKGLEWPVVFITGCEEGILPCSLFAGHDEAEEKRLFYVGMTRARQRLVLSFSERRLLDGRILEGGPSPFLKMIPKELSGPLGRWAPRRRKEPQRQMGLFS
jgi:superfamily I DNA/RNA helicase